MTLVLSILIGYNKLYLLLKYNLLYSKIFAYNLILNNPNPNILILSM